ncbi:helix-turn-helix domain-containing protein [Reichenbachiella versicolor]|uniref:helix-turn-helix domain-containing protein n=1 Tax=Reichenbachiella versicolor TaxID=1821036 RepID=UPI000D6E5E55|nr:AraC family transcriptional regulator [Reichenbachiella versicolor]
MENMIIKHLKPKKFNRYIERFTLVQVKNYDVNSLLIAPLPFHAWIIPLNKLGFYCDDHFFDKPIIQNVSLSSSNYKMLKGTEMLIIRFFASCYYPFWRFNIKNYRSVLDFFPDQMNCDDPKYLEVSSSQVYDYLETNFSQGRAEKISIIKDLYHYVLNTPTESTLETFCDDRKISYMSLYRLIKDKLNTSPIKFFRLCKFRVANYHIFHTCNNLTDIGHHSGYYDQPHFVKEFKHFVGFTPKEYTQTIKQSQIYSSSSFSNFSLLF